MGLIAGWSSAGSSSSVAFSSGGGSAGPMDAFIRLVPGWDNLLLGVQTGVWVALLAIFVIGMIARALVIFLFPHLLKPLTERIDSLNEFEMRSRISFGAAGAGLVWWKLTEYLGTEPEVVLPSTFEFWITSFAEVVFLVGLIWGVMRLVDLVPVIVAWRDEDGELDGTEKTLVTAVESVLRVMVVLAGSVLIAEAFGFDLKTLLAGLGIGGLAFAFAAKDTIGNLFGSITLLLDRPFRIGDWIKVGSSEGEVFEIGIRTTLLRTSADTVITLPNSSLVNKQVENFGRRRWRRYQPTFYLDLASDADALEAFCTGIWKLVCDHPKTQKHGSSYARVSAISKDSFEIACNLYWDVSGGNEEKDAREKFLLDVSRLAKELSLDFFEPRMRATRE